MTVEEDHVVIPYLHCKITRQESVYSATPETPFCPHCGKRLINGIEPVPDRGPRGDIHSDDVNPDGTLKIANKKGTPA